MHCAVTYSNPLLGMYDVVRIPTTLDEVRVLALHGEEIQPTKMESAGNCFLGWSTVHVQNRRMIRNEVKMERDLVQQKRKEAAV